MDLPDKGNYYLLGKDLHALPFDQKNALRIKHFGYVCVLSNNTLGKDFYTIEYTFKKLEDSTNVVAYLETDTPRLHQMELHKRLSRYRLNKKTNIFNCNIRTITKELSKI